ncbi:MAG TPA: endo-1,4-beta-xylanase [Symbiobacteriaceae bacterium]|nr:endo-1,4-beta-xylanase [Symbiobacteriaceae bacterium]
MTVEGIVQDPDGRSVAGARVEALGAAHELIGVAVTDDEGRFAVSGGGIVMLQARGPDWEGPAASVTTLPRLWRVPGSPRPAEIHTAITLQACIPVAVRAFAGGAPLDGQPPEGRRIIGRLWCFDEAGKVAPGAFRWQAGDGEPWLYLPPGQVSRLQVLWPAGDFGTLVCHADNGGRGLCAGALPEGLTRSPDGVAELWLNEDLARSACARLAAVWTRTEAEGYSLNQKARNYYGAALTALENMEAVPLPDRGDAGYMDARSRRSLHADAALPAALWAMEELVLQKAEQDVAHHRRMTRTLRLLQPDGTPAAGARVQVLQTEHDYNFGVFVNPRTHPIDREPLGGTMWTAIQELGINLLPLPLLWSLHEPLRGQRRDAETDAQLPAAALRRAGFRLKGHIHVWPWHGRYPEQWTAFTPGWLYELDAAGAQRAVYEHQRALVSYFGDWVSGFQAINEPMLSHTNALNLTLAETVELVRQSSAGIRDGGSTGPIEVNNCCLFAESVSPDVREQGYERMPCEFLADLDSAGVEYDAVGIQLGYYGGYMQSQLFQGGFPVRHLLDLADLVDHFSQAGKPVNISEVSVPSSHPGPDGPFIGEWHGPWTPERQAEWIRCFYTMCYSKPMTREITWWNITDEDAFIKDGGLMTPDYRPKPAYLTLRALIEDWKGGGDTTTDEVGTAVFTGPAGVYTVVVEHGGRKFGPFSVHFGWESSEAFEILL